MSSAPNLISLSLKKRTKWKVTTESTSSKSVAKPWNSVQWKFKITKHKLISEIWKESRSNWKNKEEGTLMLIWWKRIGRQRSYKNNRLHNWWNWRRNKSMILTKYNTTVILKIRWAAKMIPIRILIIKVKWLKLKICQIYMNSWRTGSPVWSKKKRTQRTKTHLRMKWGKISRNTRNNWSNEPRINWIRPRYQTEKVVWRPCRLRRNRSQLRHWTCGNIIAWYPKPRKVHKISKFNPNFLKKGKLEGKHVQIWAFYLKIWMGRLHKFLRWKRPRSPWKNNRRIPGEKFHQLFYISQLIYRPNRQKSYEKFKKRILSARSKSSIKPNKFCLQNQYNQKVWPPVQKYRWQGTVPKLKAECREYWKVMSICLKVRRLWNSNKSKQSRARSNHLRVTRTYFGSPWSTGSSLFQKRWTRARNPFSWRKWKKPFRSPTKGLKRRMPKRRLRL